MCACYSLNELEQQLQFTKKNCVLIANNRKQNIHGYVLAKSDVS